MNKKFSDGMFWGSVLSMILTLTVVTITQNVNLVSYNDIGKLNRITSLIERKYYGDYSHDGMLSGLYEGVCFSLDDYSAYLSYEDYEEVVDPDQEFGGIGIYSTYNKYTKVYKILSCYENTPASRAGLQKNDIIMAVDGYDVYGLEFDKMNELIRGDPGTSVSLKIDRNGETLDFDLVREVIVAPFATSEKLSSDIGYLKIMSFTGNVVDDFEHALAEIEDSKGIVIDLRGNSGGVVDLYEEIMGKLVPSGVLQTIVYKNGSREDLYCESSIDFVKYKFVVLCNDGTASCAEAMTQALADIAGARIVGTETFGKGVAQEYFRVDKNSVLRLTVGYVESPSGVSWNGVGITPDIVVEQEYLGDDFEESVLLNDSQVRAAYDLLVDELGL